MIKAFKSLPFGLLTSVLIATLTHDAGVESGILRIMPVSMKGLNFYWSFPALVLGTGLTLAMFLLLGD